MPLTAVGNGQKRPTRANSDSSGEADGARSELAAEAHLLAAAEAPFEGLEEASQTEKCVASA